jgi:ribosomal protein L20
MNGLQKSNIDLNRKSLADMAIHNPEGFADLVKQVTT